MRASISAFALLLVLGCHSNPFTNADQRVGPFNTGDDITLTRNPDQDTWPVWTPDGKGILYTFVDQSDRLHRCLGILPAAGGTRVWEMCDRRAVRQDSLSSYGGYAIDAAGRILVSEAVAPAHSPFSSLPHSFTLWLADTAHPYARQYLANFPQVIGGTTVQWVSNVTWTGPNTFLALGQQLLIIPPPAGVDSEFAVGNGIILRGTISSNGATIIPVTGTFGATGYSLAQGGSTIAFSTVHEVQLFTVPLTGGTPMPRAPVRDDTASHQLGELTGLSCKGDLCLFGKSAIVIAGDYWSPSSLDPSGWTNKSDLGHWASKTSELHSYSLSTGADQLLRTDTTRTPFSTPSISPATADVVMLRGGFWGQLQGVSPPLSNGTLHLYRGLIP